MFGALTSRPIEGSSGPNTVLMDGAFIVPETFADIDLDPFPSYFSDWDPNAPPKVLITTSPKPRRQMRHTYFARSWWAFSPMPNLPGERRDEDSRWAELRGGPQTEDDGCE